MTPPTAEERANWHRAHARRGRPVIAIDYARDEYSEIIVCDACGCEWTCPTIRLLDALEAAEAEVGRLNADLQAVAKVAQAQFARLIVFESRVDRDRLAAEVERLKEEVGVLYRAFHRAAEHRADAERVRVRVLEGMVRRHEGWHDDEEGVWRCHWCHAEVDDTDTNYDGDDPVIPHTPDCEWVAALAATPPPGPA